MDAAYRQNRDSCSSTSGFKLLAAGEVCEFDEDPSQYFERKLGDGGKSVSCSCNLVTEFVSLGLPFLNLFVCEAQFVVGFHYLLGSENSGVWISEMFRSHLRALGASDEFRLPSFVAIDSSESHIEQPPKYAHWTRRDGEIEIQTEVEYWANARAEAKVCTVQWHWHSVALE